MSSTFQNVSTEVNTYNSNFSSEEVEKQHCKLLKFGKKEVEPQQGSFREVYHVLVLLTGNLIERYKNKNRHLPNLAVAFGWTPLHSRIKIGRDGFAFLIET